MPQALKKSAVGTDIRGWRQPATGEDFRFLEGSLAAGRSSAPRATPPGSLSEGSGGQPPPQPPPPEPLMQPHTPLGPPPFFSMVPRTPPGLPPPEVVE